MSADPMSVVFALLDARRRHALEDVSGLLDPDVVHEGVTEELVCHGRNQVLHNVQQSFRADDEGIEHLELALAGPDTVILGLAGPRFRDAPWADNGAAVFVVHTVRDGRIVRMRDYLDRATAFAAAGTRPLDWP